MTTSTTPHSTADRFFGAVELNDWDTVRGLAAPDAVFAQHVGPGAGSERDVEGLIELLSGTAQHFGALRYSDVRRQVSAAGFSQMHTLGFADRPDMEVPAMVIAWLDDEDRITLVDEFLDPRPFHR